MVTTIIIFILALLLYVHLQQQFKYFTDMQIYETEYIDKSHFMKESATKLPMIIHLEEIPSIDFNILKQNAADDLSVRDVREIYKTKNSEPFSLSFSRTSVLIDTDKQSAFYSSHNSHLFSDDSFVNVTRKWDQLLKPFAAFSQYDVLFGSKFTMTPFYYHNATALFLFIPPRSKEVKIRMCPFSFQHKLQIVEDYAENEGWSPISPKTIASKNGILDFFLYSGKVLFIPPYWFYSIEFFDSKTIVNKVKYTTPLNALANIKSVFINFSQNQASFPEKEQEVIDISNTIVMGKEEKSELLISMLKTTI